MLNGGGGGGLASYTDCTITFVYLQTGIILGLQPLLIVPSNSRFHRLGPVSFQPSMTEDLFSVSQQLLCRLLEAAVTFESDVLSETGTGPDGHPSPHTISGTGGDTGQIRTVLEAPYSPHPS